MGRFGHIGVCGHEFNYGDGHHCETTQTDWKM